MADKKISQLTDATTPLAGTEVLPIVQSSTTKKVTTDNLTVKNVRSNATTGILQVTGPAAGTTRIMTVPDANFTVARTNASQTFTGDQTVSEGILTVTKNGVPQLSLTNTSGTTKNTQLLYSDNVGIKWRMGMDVATNNNTVNFQLFYGPGSASYFTVGSTGNFSVDVGNLVIGTAGKGIDFSANTNAAGMTSELLNDYEEGTFTPTVAGTTAAGTATYGRQTGRYTRIGRLVSFQIDLDWSGGTGTGDMKFTGLPFASASTNTGIGSSFVTFNMTAGNIHQPWLAGSSTEILAYQGPTGGGSVAVVPYAAAGSVMLFGSYIV